MTLSSTLKPGNGRTIWKVRPMPRRQMPSGGRPLDALAGERDGAAIGRKHPGDHVEQRGLAGAVRADHGEDAALRHLEADAVHGHKPAEPFADALRPRGARSWFALRQPDALGEPRPHAVRQRHDHQQQADAVEHLLGARADRRRARPDVLLSVSASPVRMKAPRIGPNSVPTPPTIGPRMISIEREM